MRRFGLGDIVVLRDDHLRMGMKAGESGTVVNYYEMEPPAYEVRFQDHQGKQFDALMKEDELDSPPP